MRLLAACCFTIQMTMYMAIVVYAPALALEQVKQSNEEKQEEIEYQNEKINKLTVQVEQLTLKKDQKGEVKKLEAQVALL